MFFFLQGPRLFSVFTSGHEGHSLEASLFVATCRLRGEVQAAGLAWDFLHFADLLGAPVVSLGCLGHCFSVDCCALPGHGAGWSCRDLPWAFLGFYLLS